MTERKSVDRKVTGIDPKYRDMAARQFRKMVKIAADVGVATVRALPPTRTPGSSVRKRILREMVLCWRDDLMAWMKGNIR